MTLGEFVDSLGDQKIAFQTTDNAWTSGLLLTLIIANQDGGVDYLAQFVDDKRYDYRDDKVVAAVGMLQKLMTENVSANAIDATYADSANAFMSKSAAIICNCSCMSADFAEDSADKWSNGFTGDEVTSDIYLGNISIANLSAYGTYWISNTATEEEMKLAEAFLAFRDSGEEVEALVLAEGGSAPNHEYSEEFFKIRAENRILSELEESMDENTRYTVFLFYVMPASVAETEFGKLLPKLADRSLTPEGMKIITFLSR